jgi:hypothetical protein
MRSLLLASLAAVFLAAATGAQTTGVPCINDYTINGGVSGSTSCTPISVPGGGVLSLKVSTSPTAIAVIFVFRTGSGACVAPTLCLPPVLSPLCPVPFTACAATTNQSIDIGIPFTIVPGPLCLTIPDTSMPGCRACFLSVPVPAGISFGTQAAVIDPLCFSLFGLDLMVTQAYQVST